MSAAAGGRSPSDTDVQCRDAHAPSPLTVVKLRLDAALARATRKLLVDEEWRAEQSATPYRGSGVGTELWQRATWALASSPDPAWCQLLADLVDELAAHRRARPRPSDLHHPARPHPDPRRLYAWGLRTPPDTDHPAEWAELQRAAMPRPKPVELKNAGLNETTAREPAPITPGSEPTPPLATQRVNAIACHGRGRGGCRGISIDVPAGASADHIVELLVAATAPLEAWTDGSGTIATEPAGAGVVVTDGGVVVREASEAIAAGTNNVAELWAACLALVLTWRDPRPLTIRTDSTYVKGVLEGTSVAKANPELVAGLKKLVATRPGGVRFVHVRGHSKVEHNERADELAGLARQRAIAGAGYVWGQDRARDLAYAAAARGGERG